MCRIGLWRAVAAIALLLAVAACNTTAKPTAPADLAGETAVPDQTAVSENVESANEAGKETGEETVTEDELVYDPDSLTFDIRLSAALRSADSTLFLKTPMGVNLNAIPDDLDKWLSRIRDQGGTVKAAPLPADGKPSRSLLGILIDVVLFFVGLAKEEIIFSAADDFNAVMYFDKPTGDVKWIVFTRRA